MPFYEGNWKNGKEDSQIPNLGERKFEDGSRYIGKWRNGKFDGNGKRITASGLTQDGIWSKGNFWGPDTFSRELFFYDEVWKTLTEA